MRKLHTYELGRPDIDAALHSPKLPVALVLDNIRSALNVGSIFRSADALGAARLVLCGITACPPHREILKTALGSTASVNWMYCETTEDALRRLKANGYRLWAAEQTDASTPLHHWRPHANTPCAIVLGNEVSGVSDEALALCDGALEIPQFGAKHSLNVAVAAGVILWEAARQLKLGD
ncbi:MAG: RNA methyltransferase [Saprospiraceae bacterium]